MIPFAGHDPDEQPLHAPAKPRNKPSATACKRGHKFDKRNTYWITIRGARCRRCRKCLREYNVMRYATNADYREKQQALARANYWKNKCTAQ